MKTSVNNFSLIYFNDELKLWPENKAVNNKDIK